MADTPRSLSYLTGTAFPDGKGNGAIHAQDLRDFVVSAPLWDDPSNASGLGAPAILRGTVSTYNLSGLTPGSGVSSGARTANYTAVQNALNYAAANGKFFEAYPQRIEFTSATGHGLQIPAEGFGTFNFVWRGSRTGSVFVQYGTNEPIMTIGDPTGATNMQGVDVEGFALYYGASQTGNTNSLGLVLGAASQGKIGNLWIGSSGANPAYDGVKWPVTSFSMTYDEWSVNGAQNYMLNFAAGGTTGCKWGNVYLNNGGSGVYNALNGYLNMQQFINTEMHFDQLNCEWGACNNLTTLSGTIGLRIECLHIEGIKFTGSTPFVFGIDYQNVSIETLDFIDCLWLAANMSGTAFIFSSFAPGNSVLKVQNMNIICNSAGQIDSPLVLNGFSSLGDGISIAAIDAFRWFDQAGTGQFTGHLSIDSHMPTSSFLAPISFARYAYGSAGSVVERPIINVSSTYTHYGQLENADILVPASITSFTLTLAATMGATGTQAVRTGNTVHIRRFSGTAAGTLTVRDDAGTTLTTNTTAATDLYYVFSGTHYVTFTPVT